ncbi:uncharacterized protein LOC116253458 [Nymphaea colorata]|nr:uncharacterized protein LOC116253458 [Nymphaea colorata]
MVSALSFRLPNFIPFSHRHKHHSFLAGSPLIRRSKPPPTTTISPLAYVTASSANLTRPLRVAVVGGGPAGASAAEALASGGIETYLLERNPSNAKPCGGAIPLCMIDEFGIPPEILDRRVTRMRIISPSNLTIDFGKTLQPHEFIGMLRRERLDAFLRQRAQHSGASLLHGLFLDLDCPKKANEPYLLHYTAHGSRTTLEVDAVIGADGANSRVAKSISAGDYSYAIAFQERMKLPEEKMAYYENLAEMYVGDDVSPDFYGWVFPKCDHVAVGTGTMMAKPQIKRFQSGIRQRVAPKIAGGEVIKVEAHPIPEHPRPRRVVGRVALVGDAAGYVTKCSGEGIYFAAKSGRMCGQAIVKGSDNGRKAIDEKMLKTLYLKQWDDAYYPTFRFLDILQGFFYSCNEDREALVELCGDEYVQRMTFQSYLYKTIAPGNPVQDLKLAFKTVGTLMRAKFLGYEMKMLVGKKA